MSRTKAQPFKPLADRVEEIVQEAGEHQYDVEENDDGTFSVTLPHGEELRIIPSAKRKGIDMTGIVERLRTAGENRVVVGHTKRSLCAEAADALEQRDKDIERLRAERNALQAATALCEKHPPLGARNQCVICSGEKLQAALSQISYLCEEPNEMGVSTYDVYYDEDAVVEQVRKKLGKSPT